MSIYLDIKKFSAMPATERALEAVRKAYPHHNPLKNAVEVNFYLGSIAIHAPVTIPNAAFFFDRGREF